MKKTTIGLGVLTFLLLLNCGQKKEEENFGKPATKETISDSKKSSNSKLEEGKKLFEGKGTCVACHNPETKVIGPSIKEIADLYRSSNSSIVSFLKEESDPIVDPSQYEIMKTNLSITKQMTDEELKALEEYMLSYAN